MDQELTITDMSRVFLYHENRNEMRSSFAEGGWAGVGVGGGSLLKTEGLKVRVTRRKKNGSLVQGFNCRDGCVTLLFIVGWGSVCGGRGGEARLVCPD